MSNALVGDGYCNEKMNIPECNFDGGDCCGHCETISVTIENNIQAAQGGREGIYHNSSMVNGKPSWTSTSQAIWYDQNFNDWNIGSLYDIGSSRSGIYSDSGNGCPFDQQTEKWDYYTGDNVTLGDNGWATAGANEIRVDCLNGTVF